MKDVIDLFQRNFNGWKCKQIKRNIYMATDQFENVKLVFKVSDDDVVFDVNDIDGTMANWYNVVDWLNFLDDIEGFEEQQIAERGGKK